MRVQKNNRKFIFTVVSLLLVSVLLLGTAVAKYVFTDKYSGNAVATKDFFFTIDLLGNTHTMADVSKVLPIRGGSQQDLKFSVNNFYDELRITEESFNYTVDMKVYANKTDADNEQNALTTIPAEIALMDGATQITHSDKNFSGGTKTEHDYTLKLQSGYPDGHVVVIMVKAVDDLVGGQRQAPYDKTMTLRFELNGGGEKVSYYVKDMGSYVELVAMTDINLKPGQLKVDLSSINDSANVLQVDTTNIYVLNSNLELTGANDPATQGGYLKSFIVTQGLMPEESISVYLFKSDLGKKYGTALEPGKTDVWVHNEVKGVDDGTGTKIYTIVLTDTTTVNP